MPDRHGFDLAPHTSPQGDQFGIVPFRAVDLVRDETPIDRRMTRNLVDPIVIASDIYIASAGSPESEGGIVQNDRLAHIERHA
jgi:hypothetical protein